MNDFLIYSLSVKSSISGDVSLALDKLEVSTSVKSLLGYLISEELRQDDISIENSKILPLLTKPYQSLIMKDFFKSFNKREDKSKNFYEWVNGLSRINTSVLNICLGYYIKKYFANLIDIKVFIQIGFYKIHEEFRNAPDFLNYIKNIKYKAAQVSIQFQNENEEKYTYIFTKVFNSLTLGVTRTSDGSFYIPENYKKIIEEIEKSQRPVYSNSAFKIVSIWSDIKANLLEFSNSKKKEKLPRYLHNIEQFESSHIDFLIYLCDAFKKINAYKLSKNIFPLPVSIQQKNIMVETNSKKSKNFNALSQAIEALDMKLEVIDARDTIGKLSFLEQFELDLYDTTMLLSERFGSEYYPSILEKQQQLPQDFSFISTSGSYNDLIQSLSELYSLCEYFEVKSIDKLKAKLKGKTFVFLGETQNKREDKSLIGILLRNFEVKVEVIIPEGFLHISYIPDLSPYNINKQMYPNYNEREVLLSSEAELWEEILRSMGEDPILYLSNAHLTPDSIESLEHLEYKIPNVILERFSLIISDSKRVDPVDFTVFHDPSINSILTTSNNKFIIMGLISMLLYPKENEIDVE
ncbi:MAG: Unknown protein [uncultured Campylobacterales bacterium]|uniref:Uncharacterized protein n=1 Tax=uncultured Campylobacterales bacterium TaxID=352960 RepID=A0A6S6SXX8_9BACT|nr:MAG: Unknown protein [uncultured Campylobacterales bacterium]